MHKSAIAVSVLAAVWGWGLAAAWGQTESESKPVADPRIDATTGRDTSHWPKSRPFDHQHMKLEMVISDMESKEFSAVQTLTVTPVGSARSAIVLDAGAGLAISKVTVNGAAAVFKHEGAALTVNFAGAVKRGEVVTIVSTYVGKDAGHDGNGLCWFKTRKRGGDEGEAEVQAAQLYSQGEAEWNHLWFPCHDFPNEKLTTELIVSAPKDYLVLSNGRLVSKGLGANPTDGLLRWHWLQDKPHSVYLVMIAVGKWDVVDVGGAELARPGLPMPVYGREGTAEQLKRAFRNTPRMVKFYEEYFDEPYPWAKYAQVMVRNFRWGGMENTSATTLADMSAGGGDIDALIAHELAHQWTGDLVTCKSWDHLWLNEGWATFAEWLWEEHVHGADRYMDSVRNALMGLRSPRARKVTDQAMVSRWYSDPDEVFTKADDPYAKGALVLHMLRRRLGDEGFRKATALYLDRYKFQCVETDDFRRVLEEVSGQSLERFFEQWTKRPGLPRVAVDFGWDSSKSELSVILEQTQQIDADRPAYGMRVPIWVEFEEGAAEAGGNGQWVSIDTDQKVVSKSFHLRGKPAVTTVDPNVNNAARVTIRKKVAEER